ncbi:expressed unknown protein [Seminavis robusta]|uniref:Uncharacterized protein n=1 Tax=Seminavis robusta TaxID=568900 RepID=A0A9N8EDN1_9STRA|nr:expressed unknown protein [Seminavis robusta]|eukprot:Sro790_g202880.1 n/a (649) ;mRNA; r:45051-47100
MKICDQVCLGLLLVGVCQAWCPSRPVASLQSPLSIRASTSASSRLYAAANDDKKEGAEEEESLLDRINNIDKLGDNLLDLSKVDNKAVQDSGGSRKLGINIGSQLQPLSDQEAAELKAAAMEVINDGVAEGIDEIEKLRGQMSDFMEKKKKQMELASELQLQKESDKLLNKIDKMTDDFLTKTAATREETKLINKADKSREGKGVELGVWGTIGGAAVVTTGSDNVGLLGSVDAAKLAAEKQAKQERDAQLSDLKTPSKQEQAVAVNSNRVIVIADTSQDPLAKQLVPAFSDKLQAAIPTLEAIDVYKPTDTIPLGGDNAVCALLFCTSLSDRSALNKIMDRLLRRTLQPGGALGSPPTQLIGITSLGTERTDKMPYSMQNLFGGKLDQRRQIEEQLITTVQTRVTEPPLDYTICKFGDIKDSSSNDDFIMMPGDVVDGTTSLETAAEVLLQAVAYQPFARNATLCAVGALPSGHNDDIWDDAFLRLDGPELERWTSPALGTAAVYDRLCEFLNEWANNFALNPRGLTTPIRVEPSKIKASYYDAGIRQRSGVQLLFLPTATGKNYLSREEERERESEGGSKRATISRSKMAKEGGIEVVVEIIGEDSLRVRAKRCNYADGVPLKELSEETIVKRLESAIEVWCQEDK